jgi:5-bromo-4-chloroindolyl phosphate hydrolysis protein
MKAILFTMFRLLFSGMAGFAGLLVSYFAFDLSFIISALIGVASYMAASFLIRRRYMNSSKPFGGSGDYDQAYIRRNLREAQKKLKTIRRIQFKLRSVTVWQKTSHIHKVVKRILTIIEEDPRRFRTARNFFSSYLDSTITILEKYTFLLSQPVRNAEITLALRKTEDMLDDITAALEEELLHVLSDDVLNLDVELDVMRKSIQASSSHSITLPPREKTLTKK